MRKVAAIIFLGLISLSTSVYGACFNECKAVPECAKMGYKLQGDIFCPDGYITCPFDSQYIWCKEYTCKDGRYSDTEELTGEKGYVCDEVDYHHRKCYHCHCDPDPEECQWSNLNKGVGELGDRCCDGHYASCRNLCQDKVSVPAHAHGNKESCTGCNITKDIITSWSCDDWYDQMGEACYARQCPDGYTITDARIEDCGRTKDQGWTWESKGQSGEQICGKCTAKSCSGDYSTDYPGVDSCGDSGSKGWTWNQSGWSGDDACGKCTAKECLPGFSTQYSSIASCGTSGNKGWTWEQSDQYAGNDICGKCTKKECEEGDTDPDIKSCKFESDYLGSKTENGYYSEDKKCYTCHCAANDTNCHWSEGNKGQGRLETKCCNGKYATCTSNCVKVEVPDHGQCADRCTGCETEVCSAYSCDKGYQKDNSQTKCEVAPCANGTATEASKCGNGTGAANGWETSTDTGHLSGEKKCYQCTMKDCPTGESTDYQDVSKCGTGASKGAGWTNKGTTNYHGDTRCYSCSKKACTGGYDTKYKDVNSCGKAGDSGWDWSTNGWSGDEVCGKCTPKTCPNGYSSEKKSIDDCGTTKDKGWTFEKSSTNSGENVCGKCDARQCPTDENTNASASDCGTSGENGWTKKTTGHFAGDNACYKCEKKVCEGGSSTKYQSISDCSAGCATYHSEGYSGDQKCGVCYYTVDEQVPENATCTYTTKCERGTACTKWDCNEGYTKSADGKKCDVAKCPEGYDVQKQSGPDCGNESGWRVETLGKSGNKNCGKCICESSCTWDNNNKGEKGSLTNKCCNGKYANCTNNCPNVQVPPNAYGTNPCTACNQAVRYGGWECNEGFLKLDGACVEQCKDPQVDYETCWNGSFASGGGLSDCDKQGYKHSKGDCTNFIACPTNANKIRCLH